MSFFARSGPAPEPIEERTPYTRGPGFRGPSPDQVGRPVADSFVLARTAAAAIGVQAIRAFPTGVVLEISWVLRRGAETASEWAEAREASFRGTPFGRADDGPLFGVELADGAVARTDDPFDWRDPGPGPLLMNPGGSSGGGGTERVHGSATLWLHPLPLPPTFDLVCAWPRFGVPETRRTIDAVAVLEAAAAATWLWPEDADLPLDD